MDPYHAAEGLMQVEMTFPGGELKVGGAQASVPTPHMEDEAGRLGDYAQACRPGGGQSRRCRGSTGEGVRPARPSLPTSQLSSNQISTTSLLLHLPRCTLFPHLSL